MAVGFSLLRDQGPRPLPRNRAVALLAGVLMTAMFSAGHFVTAAESVQALATTVPSPGGGSVDPTRKESPRAIDLTAALRLAGAQSLDIKIANERVAEARANYQVTVARFFPWISPGITYRQHQGKLQDVEGNILEVHKDSYAPGATLGAQVDLGEALYQRLVARQLVGAAVHVLETQRQETVLAAAQGYFDLALAGGSMKVAEASVRISSDYRQQLDEAVNAGIAFKGDLLRVRVELERNRLALRRAEEERRIASARLAQVLRLDAEIELEPLEPEVAPLALLSTNLALHPLIEGALSVRPELKQNQMLAGAARNARSEAVYGPLIPSVGAQAFFGGLGGGRHGIPDTFGYQEDLVAGLSWRLGPGGILDFTRRETAEARLRIIDLNGEKLKDSITREVVEAFTHWQSLQDQLETVRQALAAAEEGLQLARTRKEFAVGIVLENIQAEQDLTRARLDFLRVVAEFNKAQYALSKAAGKL